MRIGEAERKTDETEIHTVITIDGRGEADLSVPVGFMAHMLDLLVRHGGFDLEVSAAGDTHIDDHHLIEDLGITLGLAFRRALGDKRGIRRYGSLILPMDEVLVLAAVDLGGRPWLGFDIGFEQERVGSFETGLVREFWQGFVSNSFINLHFRLLTPGNTHHVIEGLFKAAGRALREAVSDTGEEEIPSTKGTIEGGDGA